MLPLLLLFGLLVGAGTAAAGVKEPVTITPMSQGPGFSEYSVYNFDVLFVGADDVAGGFVNGRKAGHCIEATVLSGTGQGKLLTGVEGTDLSLANADPGNLAVLPGGRDRLEWILLSSRRAQLDTPAGPQRAFEAAAHQMAVWRLTNPGSAPDSADARTDDPAIAARSQQLVDASATHGPNVGRAPAIAPVGPDVCSGTNRTLRVTGSPLTTATLAITAGQGRFASGTISADGQQTVVALGASGTTDVALAGTAVGTVAVRGAFERATLVQAELPSLENGQDFAYVEVRTVTVDAPVMFVDCTPPTPGVTPSTPGTTTNPGTTPTPGITPTPTPIATGAQTTRLRITKAAPRNARVKAAVSYGITVSNVGTSAASDVIVTDPVPAGMTIVRMPANARLVKGVIRWSLGVLQPGQKVTVRVALRTNLNVTRSRCNVATASAGNASSVRARVCTNFVRIAGAVRLPIVTG